MRKTLPVLALLTALAAVASAQSTAVNSSSLIASYTLGSGATFGGYTSFEYDHVGTDNFGGFDTDGGKATVARNGGTTHSHVDGSNLFTMGSLTSVALDSPDYSAIDPMADPYADEYLGYTYVMSFTGGASGGTVTFHMHAVQTLIGSAASPYGLQVYSDPDATSVTRGAYARGVAGAGVIDVTSDPTNSATDPDHLGSYVSTSHEDTTLVPTATYEMLSSGTFSSTFTLGAGETRMYRFYASTHAAADFYNPVPEPSAFAALGLGALGLLRRRRK